MYYSQILTLAFMVITLSVSALKTNTELENILQSAGKANVIVSLSAGTASILDTICTTEYASREDRLNAVGSALKSHSVRTQASVLQVIQGTPDQKFESIWISNQIYVPNASLSLVKTLSEMSEVSQIEEEKVVKIDDPRDTSGETASPILIQPKAQVSRQGAWGTNEWGVDQIHASNAWAVFNNGTNIIVGNIDTGVRYTHETLITNYRRSYGWFDPYNKTWVPNDQSGHGTHTMGTIAGIKGIGVAPGTKWMACKGCDSNTRCTAAALLACGQWITCPTLPNGGAPDCTRAPHVINNSWGGGQNQTWFDGVIRAWRAARIIPVFSAMNSGPACGTIKYPGEHPDVITVGATDNSKALAYFSSKGPTVGRGIRKPDVSAPGVDVRSAYHTGDKDYYTMSGTSMAAPHVSGVVALILAQKPKSTFDQVKNNLIWSAQMTTGYLAKTGYNCGGSEIYFPNNNYGYGIVDAITSVSYAVDHNS